MEETLSLFYPSQLNLTDEEITVYRAHYLEPGESRRPTLDWAREICIDGVPADTHDIIADYGEWLANLLIGAGDPGAIVGGDELDLARTWSNQTEVTVADLHIIKEDSPFEIAVARICCRTLSCLLWSPPACLLWTSATWLPAPL